MRKYKKLLRMLLLIALALSVFSIYAYAEDTYEKLWDESGASELTQELPDEAKDLMPDISEEKGIDIKLLWQKLFQKFKEEWESPVKALFKILAAMIITAAAGTLYRANGAINTLNSLFIGLTVCIPVSSCIETAAEMIKAASVFILSCTPVMAGIMAVSGQESAAFAHSFMMLAAGDVISVVSSVFMVPMLHVFLMLSLVTDLSFGIRTDELCDVFYKAVKWTLVFSMTVFSALMGIQTLLTSNADAISIKTAKFAVSNFVPIVGSALSDGVAAVAACLNLLKSGVGAIGVLGVFVTVAPVMIKCFVWYIVCFSGQAFAGILGISTVGKQLKAIGKCIEMIMLMLICCLMIMTVSSAVVLIGGKSG